MKLLVLTQAVDTEDPVLGFMHRWIEEIAKKYEHVEVICLKEGKHDLPTNVTVHSLGKSAYSGQRVAFRKMLSRLRYIYRFYSYIFALRREYDAVFVHMNQEYVLLGGPFWNIARKPVVLWRNHKLGFLSTDIAASLVRTVCYTSPSAYAARFKNSVRMPIGIDTEHFRPDPQGKPAEGSVLFLGRIDGVKRPLLFVDALKSLVARGVAFHADIYGAPTYADDPVFASFKSAVEPLAASGRVSLHPSSRNSDNPAIYTAHSVYVNLTPSGSFDKTIGEAMACGAIVVAANTALRGILPDTLITESDDGEAVAQAIKAALMLSPNEREEIVRASRDYVEKEHSLELLITELKHLTESR